MELYLLRHGETDWNRENVFRGLKDVSLSREGEEEARRCALWFKDNLQVDVILSSPLKRATRLAELIATLQGKKFQEDEHLLDFSFGEWEGQPKEEVKRKDPANWDLWEKKPFSFKAPGEGKTLGEKIEEVYNYIKCDLYKKYETQKVLLITHRVILKGLFLKFFSLDDSYFWKMDIETTALSWWSVKGEHFYLRKHNCKYW